MTDFDQDMLQVMKYHRKLVRLCRQIAALGDDSAQFDRLTQGRFKDERNNQRIRWCLEDSLRELLWQNGDYKSHTFRTEK